MKKLILLLLLLFPVVSLAVDATASWDSTGQVGVTYTVFENGIAIPACTEIAATSCTVDKQGGDEFYVVAILNGSWSEPSSVAVIPFTPSNFKVTVVIDFTGE